jgi:hypothetical protein
VKTSLQEDRWRLDWWWPPSPAAPPLARGLELRRLAGESRVPMRSEPTMAASSNVVTLLKTSLLQSCLMPNVTEETLDLG